MTEDDTQDMSATSEEIEKWEEEHEEPHPVFEVNHRPERKQVFSDGSVEMQGICDEFVREHAVAADDAESWVHIGIDDHFHPAGGYWFPTGEKWGDSSGWVSSKYDIPHGDVVQYPCSENGTAENSAGSDSLPEGDS